jgi:hypothetical protein
MISNFDEYAKRRERKWDYDALVERLEQARQAIMRKGDGEEEQHTPQRQSPVAAPPQIQDTTDAASTGEQAPGACRTKGQCSMTTAIVAEPYAAYPAELADAARAVETELAQSLMDDGLPYEVDHAIYVFRRMVVPVVQAAANKAKTSSIGLEYWAEQVGKRARSEAYTILNAATTHARTVQRMAEDYFRRAPK